jgi:predicted  nucleic acid-binding Zn-ribbon protein
MRGSDVGPTVSSPDSTAGATFALERFEWSAPDLLEVAGRFAHVPDTALAEPVLIVRSGDSTDRLVPTDDSGVRPAHGALRRIGGSRWRASFAWRGTPSAFERAILELGEEFVVALPAPGAQRGGRRVLRVSRREPAAPPPVERVGLQAELAATREEVESLRAKLQDAHQVGRRLRQDLEAHRKRRDAEAKRFQDALNEVRRTAEEAVAVERSKTEGLVDQVEEARHAAEQAQGDLATLREELEAAREAGAAHERLQAELDEKRREADEARRELESAKEELDAVVGQLSAVRANVDAVARTGDQLSVEIQRLRAHVSDGAEEEGTSPRAATSDH